MQRFFLVLALFVGILPGTIQAHGGDTVSYMAEVNGYTIDVGYSEENPLAREPVQFDFVLLRGEEVVPFTNVWVRIETETGANVFAGGIHRTALEVARMSYVFAEPGTHTIHVRYENNNGTLAEGSFPLHVRSAEGEVPPLNPLLAGMVGIIGGVVLALLAQRFLGRRSYSPKHSNPGPVA